MTRKGSEIICQRNLALLRPVLSDSRFLEVTENEGICLFLAVFVIFMAVLHNFDSFVGIST